MKQTTSESGKKFFTKKKIIMLSVLLVIFGLCVWDIGIDPPAFWHFRQADKQAIVQYQRKHYPGAKVVEQDFPFFPNKPVLVGIPVNSRMTFEYDGVEFSISARDGELTGDYFPYARAASQIENTIYQFIQSNNIENEGVEVDVRFDLLHASTKLYPFDDPPTDDLSEYNHRIDVDITIIGEYSSPKDVGWLYDCYQYWISECVLKDYSLNFKVVPTGNGRLYNAAFYNDSEITSEKEFYSEFNSY
ncbi:MAG: hypothetical protein J1F28_06090 [Oscillospiraceae bacterium]|nr:hypothetical protein [Oscillospiraceae bacterium]